MLLYAILLVIHVLSSVVWLGLFPADLILRKSIRDSKGKPEEPGLILSWLKILNIGGIIGLTGVLFSGLLLTIKFDYGFFQFAAGANHWLYTKQLIMVILIIIVGAFLIPNAKKVSGVIKDSANSPDELLYKNINKLGAFVSLQNILVLLNFLLALTRRFIY